VIRLESFRERAEALEAVGLSEQAMSRENVDRMRSYYKLFNERRLDEWLLTFDPNVQWHTRRDEPDTTTYHGREGMLELAERWIESFPDFRVDPEEFHAIADCVIVVSRLRGSGSASRLAVDVVYVFAHRLLHGLVLETWACTTKDEALEAVGLSE
jgi:ketosteroid isomerase-like protein